jgi:LysM repeat protein
MKTDPLFSKYGTSSSGTTVDVGCIYRGIKGYSFGIFISNFILTKIGIKDKDTVPVLIKLGIAHRYYPYFDASLDIVYSQTGFGLCAGIEKKFENKYFLRGGFGWFQNEKRYITIGAGYNIKLFQIDYSFFFPLSGMTSTYGSHRFSLNIRIGNVPIEDETSFREIPLIPKAMYDEELEKVRKELKDALEMIDKLRREVNINQQKLNEMTKLASSLAERLERMEKGERKVVVVERPSSKPEKPRFYTVKEGDTLKSIAKQIYNDESKWIDIYKANQDKVKQGLLTPGDVLVIP